MKRINEILTTKRKVYLVVYLFIFIFLVSCIKSVQFAKADTNYSNFLTSESIDVKNDRALILYESSGTSNNYRNYYETGFLFPSKLRTEMYSSDLTTNPAKYYIQQAYLDDLDSEFAFSDVENLGQYETNDFIDNYTDIIENNGYYESSTKESYFIPLIPNENIQNEPEYYLNYTRIDDYGIADDGEFVAFSWLPDRKLQYGFTDYNFTEFNSDIIKISVYYEIYTAGGQKYPNNKIRTWLTSNGTYNEYYDFDLSTIWTTYYITHDFYQFNNDLTFDNLTIQLDMVLGESISHIKKACLKIYVNQTSKILGSNDYNYYNYITNGSGESGTFPAEYTFTGETGVPTDWTDASGASCEIQVISDLDGHSDVLEFTDGSASTKSIGYQTFSSSKASGTIELWFRYDASTIRPSFALRDSDLTHSLYMELDTNVLKSYWSGSYRTITTLTPDKWYHFRIEFDTTNHWHLWIDKVQQDYLGTPELYYYGVVSAFDDIYLETNILLTTECYFDAVDYSWSSGYFENRNYIDSVYSLNVSSQLGIERTSNNFDNLESLELEYTIKGNSSCNLDLYLYNINSENYDLVDTKAITTTFQEFSYTFDLNYTYYSTLGLINFTFYYESSNIILFSFDKINLKAMFSNFSLNSEGFHNIDLKFNRETSASTNRGNISFNMKLYKDYFSYDYIENNVIETDYSRINQIVNFSTEIEQIYECEIQYHIRYGLNTLDIDIVNTYVMIIINYNYTFELFEQLRFGNNDGNYFRSEISYDSMNFNRLNNTGIFGNYSMNCLSGLRVLRGTTAINYNRYFLIPYFDEKISLSYSLGVSTSGSGSEPRLPIGSYWTYETFRLADSGNTGITVENWSVDFRSVEAEKYEAKYFYKEKTLRRSSLGSWTFKIGEIKVSFNFLRNAITDIINVILVFFQYLFFLVTASLSYIFMYLGINIIVLLWNIVVYYVFTALIWILWYLYSAIYWLLLWLWDALIWIYEVVLIPAYIWITEVALPYLVEFVIIPAIAFTLTLIIWIITLGRLDFWELYEVIEAQLYILSDSFNVIVLELIDHIVEVVIFISLYLLLIGMCYIKHIVVKVRGYVNRSNALEESLNAYLYPLIIFYKICLAIKQLIANWF